MKDVFDEVIRTTLVELGARFRDFVPNLLAMLVLLAVGILAAVSIRFSVGFVLKWLAFDRFSERTGISTVLQKGGIRAAPSRVLALVLPPRSWILTFRTFVVFREHGIAAGKQYRQYPTQIQPSHHGCSSSKKADSGLWNPWWSAK